MANFEVVLLDIMRDQRTQRRVKRKETQMPDVDVLQDSLGKDEEPSPTDDYNSLFKKKKDSVANTEKWGLPHKNPMTCISVQSQSASHAVSHVSPLRLNLSPLWEASLI